jgi:hypothetical protein
LAKFNFINSVNIGKLKFYCFSFWIVIIFWRMCYELCWSSCKTSFKMDSWTITINPELSFLVVNFIDFLIHFSNLLLAVKVHKHVVFLKTLFIVIKRPFLVQLAFKQCGMILLSRVIPLPKFKFNTLLLCFLFFFTLSEIANHSFNTVRTSFIVYEAIKPISSFLNNFLSFFILVLFIYTFKATYLLSSRYYHGMISLMRLLLIWCHSC